MNKAHINSVCLPASTTGICVSAQGYQPNIVEVSVTPGATQTVNVQLPTPASTTTVTLSGVVNSITMQPESIAGATVYATTYYANPRIMAPIFQYTAVTGTDGSYKLPLPAGQYMVYAVRGNMQSPTVTLQLTADTTQDFTLEPGITPQPTPMTQ